MWTNDWDWKKKQNLRDIGNWELRFHCTYCVMKTAFFYSYNSNIFFIYLINNNKKKKMEQILNKK